MVVLIVQWSLHPTSDQGDVGSNPAQGNYSFPQKLSSVEFPVIFSQFLLNLDCESICDPPGGDTLLAQGIYLTDSATDEGHRPRRFLLIFYHF